MPRPTIEKTTASGHKVVVREWITLAEHRSIMAVFMKTIKVQADEKEAASATADSMVEAQDLGVRYIVESLDGSSENIVQRIQELPNHEAQEILDIVEEISSPKKK